MSVRLKKIIFAILLSVILVFFIWSELIWVSFALIIVADISTIKISSNFIKERIPIHLFIIGRYIYFILLPFATIAFIRLFFFDVYFVPSRSMERTLSPNDYVIVNKFKYGVKLPFEEKALILSRTFNNGNSSNYRKLNHFGNLVRNDIVVFKSSDNTNQYLVKRIIGLPGDTIHIKNRKVIINRKVQEEKKTFVYRYIDVKDTLSDKSNLFYSNEEFENLNDMYKDRLQYFKFQSSSEDYIFPFSKKGVWSIDNYGPIVCPTKGMKIILDKENIDIYYDILKKYEDFDSEFGSKKMIVYTFKNSYYFMLGDNRHSSVDSRVFGFIPENNICGKVIYKWSKEGYLN